MRGRVGCPNDTRPFNINLSYMRGHVGCPNDAIYDTYLKSFDPKLATN